MSKVFITRDEVDTLDREEVSGTDCFRRPCLNSGLAALYAKVPFAFCGPELLPFAVGDMIPEPFSAGDTIPEPFPVGDFPLRGGPEWENYRLKEKLRRLRLEKENEELRREIERLERGAQPSKVTL